MAVLLSGFNVDGQHQFAKGKGQRAKGKGLPRKKWSLQGSNMKAGNDRCDVTVAESRISQITGDASQFAHRAETCRNTETAKRAYDYYILLHSMYILRSYG